MNTCVCPKGGGLLRVGAGLWLACCLSLLTGPAQAERPKIYTCVDASGRVLTSDRPIPACNDREQRILDGVTGHQRGTRSPSYTAEEQRAMQKREQERQAEVKRERDAKQREQILLSRYPDEAAHMAARERAKETVRAVTASANVALEGLEQESQRLKTEMEFYQNDPSKVPPVLKRQVETNQKAIEDQKNFIAGKREEEQRIDAQFDVELKELQSLWARQ